MTLTESAAEILHAPSMSIVLIGPDVEWRRALSGLLSRSGVHTITEVDLYPARHEAALLADGAYDAVIIDLDTNFNRALTVVETMCASNPRVMAIAYSRSSDPDVLLRCMRVGARELLREPVSLDAVEDVLLRVNAWRGAVDKKTPAGKLSLFWGAKGGAGTSTLASVFATTLAEETKEKVALVDLDPEMGCLSLMLRASPRFSIMDAVANSGRMDWEFLSSMMVEHESGVSLLASPDAYNDYEGRDTRAQVATVLSILRDHFPYVVVDGATNRNLPMEALQAAAAIYLVTQMDVPSLHNAHRLITYLGARLPDASRLQVVVNRCNSSKSDITLAQAERTLTVPIAWQVPNSYAEASEALNTGMPSRSKSSLRRAVQNIAMAAAGKSTQAAKAGWKFW